MNPGSGDRALDSGVNEEKIEWTRHSDGRLTKQPDRNRSISAMDEELEMELINIMNSADKRSRCMITMPAINSGRMGSCYFAAGMKPELDMRRIAASFTNSAEATSVTTMAVPGSSCGIVINNMSGAANTNSGFHRYSSALPSGPAAPVGGLCRGSGAVKVKKKRVRPSRRVPTTVVKTDASNFKAMVEHFTGIPTPITTTQESATSPSASTSSPPSTSSASSPSFSKPLPHPAVCKIPNSSAATNPNTSAATTTCSSPLLSSSFPTCQSLPDLPFMSTIGSISGSGDISNSVDQEELTMTSLIDTTFFDDLWR